MNLDKYPYFTIWFRPSQTFHKILRGGKKIDIRIPIIISAVSGTIGSELLFSEFGGPSVIYWIIGVIFGYLALIGILPWLILLTGKLLGGNSNFRKMQLVIGLSQIPTIMILVLQLLYLIFGKIKSPEEVSYAVQFIAWIFYLRILITGLSIVQKFTYGLAIINLAILLLPLIFIKLKLG
jgi:hypothetical protein